MSTTPETDLIAFIGYEVVDIKTFGDDFIIYFNNGEHLTFSGESTFESMGRAVVTLPDSTEITADA